MGQFYVSLIVFAVLFAILFVAFYVYRLIQARRALTARPPGHRSPLGLQEAGFRFPHDPPVSGARRPDDAPADEVGAVRTHERAPGLRQVSAEPVFVRRSRAGEVTVQIDARPAMPLRYLLDARAKSVLERVAAQASSDFGESWAVLAEEDARGRLKLTRLA